MSSTHKQDASPFSTKQKKYRQCKPRHTRNTTATRDKTIASTTTIKRQTPNTASIMAPLFQVDDQLVNSTSSPWINSTSFFFQDIEAPDSFKNTRYFAQTITVLGTMAALCFAIIITRALRNIRGPRARTAKKRQTLRLLLGNHFCTACFNIWYLLTCIHGMDVVTCETWGIQGGV